MEGALVALLAYLVVLLIYLDGAALGGRGGRVAAVRAAQVAGGTVALLLVMVYLDGATPDPVANYLLGLGLLVASAAWAAWDAWSLNLRKYEGGYGGYVRVFFYVLLIWIVCFPVYLHTRLRRLAGELEPREEYRAELEVRPRAASAAADGPPGIDWDESWQGTEEGRAARLPWVLLALVGVIGSVFFVLPRLVAR